MRSTTVTEIRRAPAYIAYHCSKCGKAYFLRKEVIVKGRATGINRFSESRQWALTVQASKEARDNLRAVQIGMAGGDFSESPVYQKPCEACGATEPWMVKPYPKLSKANSICIIGFLASLVLILALIIIYAHTSLPHWLPRLLLFLELGLLIASIVTGIVHKNLTRSAANKAFDAYWALSPQDRPLIDFDPVHFLEAAKEKFKDDETAMMQLAVLEASVAPKKVEEPRKEESYTPKDTMVCPVCNKIQPANRKWCVYCKTDF